MSDKSALIKSAKQIPNVSVKVGRKSETVCIRDADGEFEDIFMQGQDAAQFIKELDDMFKTAPGDMLMEDAIKSVAAPYCENLWGQA